MIKETLNEFLKESINLNPKYIDDLKKELSKFNTSEELLRSGGLSIELLDRLAYGFSEKDIKTINSDDLKVLWTEDLENVKHEIKQSGLSKKQWSETIDLSEPIDVDYMQPEGLSRGFYIQDGHHRYYAAKTLKRPLNVNLEIKINPIKEIAPNLSYDEFHRHIFDLYGNYDTITVYHGTKPKFVNDIKENGLIDKTGYNQG